MIGRRALADLHGAVPRVIPAKAAVSQQLNAAIEAALAPEKQA